MAAQFYGSITDTVTEDDNPEGLPFNQQEHQLHYQQGYQSSMLTCQEISEDVRKMKTEIVSLKKDVNEIRAERASMSKSKPGSNKLPEGLSVSSSMHK